MIFNEADGGGAKFEGANGFASFAGVNSNVKDGIGAQLYDINVAENKGSKLDVTANGIFYTSGDDSALPAAQRDIEANELATKKDIAAIDVPEYSLRKETNPGDFAAIYHLTKDGTDIGEAINIAKDQLLRSVEVKICEEEDIPVEGLEVGDKYLDFDFIVEAGAEAHTYIAIKDMVKPYTAGNGIVITAANEITFDPEVLATVEEVNAAVELAQGYINQKVAEESAERIAADNGKVDKNITGANGVAQIFNEADGGGAHFIHNDGTEAFVGVNDGGKDGLMAQIYADEAVDGGWIGSRINVYNDKIYYTNRAAVEGGAAKNEAQYEIATKKDLAELEIDALTEEEIKAICI